MTTRQPSPIPRMTFTDWWMMLLCCKSDNEMFNIVQCALLHSGDLMRFVQCTKIHKNNASQCQNWKSNLEVKILIHKPVFPARSCLEMANILPTYAKIETTPKPIEAANLTSASSVALGHKGGCWWLWRREDGDPGGSCIQYSLWRGIFSDSAGFVCFF